jgi:hypothetical protein
MEQWLPVVGWEGFYEVSIEGIVRYANDRTRKSVRAGDLVNRVRASRGNVFVPLSQGTVISRKSASVARIVAETFIGPSPGSGYIVRHLDKDQSNCAVDNLRWALRTEKIR